MSAQAELSQDNLHLIRSLRVLVVDDQEVLRWGLRVALHQVGGVARCLGAGTRDDALRLAARYEPRVAIVNAVVEQSFSHDLVRQLSGPPWNMRVLVIYDSLRPPVTKMRAAGAVGLLSKDAPVQQYVAAVAAVAQGRPPARPEEPNPLELSIRERQVLALLAEGATNREVASHLELSPHTVKDHTRRLYRKLGVPNRTAAVHSAERRGLLPRY